MILQILNSPEYRDLSPSQIVPRLADQGIYLASESTMYRILREEKQLKHRAAAKPATHHHPRELVATAPNQVWSWDISYLPGPIRGKFYYLYTIIDVFSRDIMGEAIYEEECQVLAAALIQSACDAQGVDPDSLALHSDNGGPMKGSTMLAKLEELGVMASFSRPGVCDDNPYSESLFKTAKYRPEYPARPFESLEHARTWLVAFVQWYRHEHRHSGIKFVTPAQRHAGEDIVILAKRREVYEKARARNPERWSGNVRDWSRIETVRLNPNTHHAAAEAA